MFGEPTIYTGPGNDGIWRTSDDVTSSTSDVGNPYLFTGRRYDDETGLYYYRARMYHPELGRFMQPDPIGYDDGLNLYSYCGSNPLRWADPYGLCKGNLLNKLDKFVRSSSAMTSVGAFVIGALETMYNLESALAAAIPHPFKSLGEFTVSSLENIYDSEVALYNSLHALAYDPSAFSEQVGRSILQSDFLSSDPYVAGHAIGSLTMQIELSLAVAEVASHSVKFHPPHGPHHRFLIIGKRRHLQATVYKKGVKGSHFNIRVPY